MKKIKTVFGIGNSTYTVEATGQEAVKAIRKEFRLSKITLVGFYVDDKFIPADLN